MFTAGTESDLCQKMLYSTTPRVRSSVLVISTTPSDESLIQSTLPNALKVAESTEPIETKTLFVTLNMTTAGVHSDFYSFPRILYSNFSKIIHERITFAQSNLINSLKDTMPSKSSFTFKYGVNTAFLENVCLLNKTAILYFSSDNDFLDDEILLHLNKSFSGFYTNNPDYSGWRFVSWNSLDQNTAQDFSDQTSNWIHGTSVMMSPPYTPSIFHHSQVLLTLYHASQNSDIYPWVKNVDRVFLVF